MHSKTLKRDAGVGETRDNEELQGIRGIKNR